MSQSKLIFLLALCTSPHYTVWRPPLLLTTSKLCKCLNKLRAALPLLLRDALSTLDWLVFPSQLSGHFFEGEGKTLHPKDGRVRNYSTAPPPTLQPQQLANNSWFRLDTLRGIIFTTEYTVPQKINETDSKRHSIKTQTFIQVHNFQRKEKERKKTALFFSKLQFITDGEYATFGWLKRGLKII